MDQSMDQGQLLAGAQQAALEGGKVLLQYWGKLKDIREKGHAGDLVTEADRASEEVILAYLKHHFPIPILAEESGMHQLKEADYLWVVDPLDGTTNYAHQFPFVAVSIGLLHKGESIVGVVYNPVMNELFAAMKGKGATLNGQSIQVSKTTSIQRSLLVTGFAYDRRETSDNNYPEFCQMTSLSQGVRRLGSASIDLAYVAAGRFDGYWERGLREWDMAAGVLLVEEAGGRVSGYANQAFDLHSGRVLASNGFLHQELSNELQKVARK